MIKMILSALKSMITQELLLSLFKDVFMDYLMSEMEAFVKDTETSADDKLLAEFKDWVAKKG
jgi:hypothetical protein